MRALGIDPGSRVTGWGVVERAGATYRRLAGGVLRLDAREALAGRLARLHAECLALLDAWRPDTIVLERNFVAHNVQSAFRLGEVRGVAALRRLDARPSADAADALALALCHLQQAPLLAAMASAARRDGAPARGTRAR